MRLTRASPAPEDDLRQAARALGRALPAAYEEFLRANNGGRPRMGWLPDTPVEVSEFLGVGLPDDLDLISVRDAYRDRVPSRYLPIAHAEGGNLILLSADEHDPAVYFWDHEQEVEAGGEDGALELVASSFEQFVAALSPTPDVPVAQVEEVWADPDFLRELGGS